MVGWPTVAAAAAAVAAERCMEQGYHVSKWMVLLFWSVDQVWYVAKNQNNEVIKISGARWLRIFCWKRFGNFMCSTSFDWMER